MNEQATKLLEQLAQKLGTTVEYLWGILIQQAQVDAFVNLGYLIILIIAWIIGVKLHFYLSKNEKYEKDNTGLAWAAIMIIFAMILIPVSIVMFFFLGNIVTGLINPEYWALKQVLNLIQ